MQRNPGQRNPGHVADRMLEAEERQRRLDAWEYLGECIGMAASIYLYHKGHANVSIIGLQAMIFLTWKYRVTHDVRLVAVAFGLLSGIFATFYLSYRLATLLFIGLFSAAIQPVYDYQYVILRKGVADVVAECLASNEVLKPILTPCVVDFLYLGLFSYLIIIHCIQCNRNGKEDVLLLVLAVGYILAFYNRNFNVNDVNMMGFLTLIWIYVKSRRMDQNNQARN